MAIESRSPRRKIPSLDALLRSEPGKRAASTFGRDLVKHTLTRALDQARAAASRGVPPPEDDVLLARALAAASRAASGLTPVLNATGVILHTGLGRARLPESAARAAARAGRCFVDLELERETGSRGRRTTRAELMLTALTGAEAALAVNNGAAALLLALAALARRKEVIVSRGELIEIGGEFRIPDILSASGAKLVEVGTTNRTRLLDYRSAITERTGLVLKVHPSNYRVVGFTSAPSTRELAAMAAKARLPLLYDLGSGLLERHPAMPQDEPSAKEALAEGANLVVFSGDKLLGGPQAGVVLGRGDLVERLRHNPIARAVRVDKMQVAALERVLADHVAGRRSELPVWRMLGEPAEQVKLRAQRLANALDGELEGAHVVASEATIGGGSAPGHAIASWAVEVRVPDPAAMAARLRDGSPAVFCRTAHEGVVFDARTVTDDELPRLARAILYALEGDDLAED